MAAKAPSTTPTSIFPRPGLLPGVLVVEAVAADAVLACVLLAELELVLDTLAGIFIGFKVPHVLQDWDPGVSIRHCLNTALQTKLGTVSVYCAMSGGGEEPLLQAHM